MQHLFNRGIEEVRHVITDLVVHSRRKGFHFKLRQLRLDLLDDLVRVAAVALLDHNGRRGTAIKVRVEVVELAAEFHCRHILQPQQLAALRAAQDDIFILFHLVVAAHVSKHVFERL